MDPWVARQISGHKGGQQTLLGRLLLLQQGRYLRLQSAVHLDEDLLERFVAWEC
jgi:hypothetical protein